MRKMQSLMESCYAKTVMSGVMGFGLGGMFGAFMASVSCLPVSNSYLCEEPVTKHPIYLFLDVLRYTYAHSHSPRRLQNPRLVTSLETTAPSRPQRYGRAIFFDGQEFRNGGCAV